MSGPAVLVTGATSQLGRLVVGALLARGLKVTALVRSLGAETTEALRVAYARELRDGALSVVVGDVLEADAGLGREGLERLGETRAILHLARPRAGEAAPSGALVRGLDGVAGLARRLLPGLRRLVVLSTTAVSGDYPGRFYEHWLDIGQGFSSERAREVFELERRARASASQVPVVVTRHGLLVGATTNGRIECRAGLDRLLALGPLLARLPSWFPIPGAAEGPRYVTVSPVDYLAEGLVEIALTERLAPGAPAATFCLADPSPPTLGELTGLLLDRVGGPEPGPRLPVDGRGPVGTAVLVAARGGARLGAALGRPPGVLSLLLGRNDHDTAGAESLLDPAGIRCPRLATYLDAIYSDYLARRGRSSVEPPGSDPGPGDGAIMRAR